jgi:hypothetical protein
VLPITRLYNEHWQFRNDLLCKACTDRALVLVYAIRTLDERPSMFIRDKPISPEMMLHKDYDRKSSFDKNLWSWVSRGLVPRQADLTLSSICEKLVAEAGDSSPLEATTKQRLVKTE